MSGHEGHEIPASKSQSAGEGQAIARETMLARK